MNTIQYSPKAVRYISATKNEIFCFGILLFFYCAVDTFIVSQKFITRSTVNWNKNSSRDEIANVLVNDDIAHT